VRSPIPLPVAVQRLTGITPAPLAAAPPLAQTLPQLTLLLARGGSSRITRPVPTLHMRLLAASLRRVGVSWTPARRPCALQAFTGYRASVGVPIPGGGATLDDACAQMGIRRGGAHRARDDRRADGLPAAGRGLTPATSWGWRKKHREGAPATPGALKTNDKTRPSGDGGRRRMAGKFTRGELEQLASALRDAALDIEPREEVRHRYEPLLAADGIMADGVDLVITLDDGRTLRYQPCEEDD
jgi:hypothetical protein